MFFRFLYSKKGEKCLLDTMQLFEKQGNASFLGGPGKSPLLEAALLAGLLLLWLLRGR